MDLIFGLCTCTCKAKQCKGYYYFVVYKCNYMYMSVSMLINSLFLVATSCLAVIFLTMYMRGEKGRGKLLKLSARRKHSRTANCGQRAIQKSHIILYQLNYHHDEVIAAGRCGLDICIAISKFV